MECLLRERLVRVCMVGLIALCGTPVLFAAGASEPDEPTVSDDSATRESEEPSVAATEIQDSGSYAPYTAASFEEAKGQMRVYFFHAGWCPTCRAADSAFRARRSEIPPNVALFKIDYDYAVDLRKQYGVTYQHTFVLVDDQGELVKRWAGGDVSALIQNVGDGS